jgi:hypothetical protein
MGAVPRGVTAPFHVPGARSSFCTTRATTRGDRFNEAARKPGISRGTAMLAAVAVPTFAPTIPQPTGPSGVQPKNCRTPGVFTSNTSAAADAALVTITARLRPPVVSGNSNVAADLPLLGGAEGI